MPLYTVMVSGENAWLALDGEVQRLGFYTKRVVEADGPHDACALAVALVDSQLRQSGRLQNPPGDSPRISADGVAEADGAARDAAQPGFAWYRE